MHPWYPQRTVVAILGLHVCVCIYIEDGARFPPSAQCLFHTGLCKSRRGQVQHPLQQLHADHLLRSNLDNAQIQLLHD